MNNKSIYRKWGIIAFITVTIICAIAFFFLDTHRGENQWNNYGEAAGIFTAIGTYFTGLSFAAFIITLLMQQAELKLQAKNLKDNTKALLLQEQAMNRQRDEFIKSNEQYKEQDIKKTCFFLIDKLQEARNNLILYDKESSQCSNFYIGQDSVLLKGTVTLTTLDKKIINGEPISAYSDKGYIVGINTFIMLYFQILKIIDLYQTKYKNINFNEIINIFMSLQTQYEYLVIASFASQHSSKENDSLFSHFKPFSFVMIEKSSRQKMFKNIITFDKSDIKRKNIISLLKIFSKKTIRSDLLKNGKEGFLYGSEICELYKIFGIFKDNKINTKDLINI